MKHLWLILALLIGIAGSASTAGAARPGDDESVRIEARAEGYKTPVKVPDSSTAVTWIVMIVLAGLTISGMFKDAKRSHLD